MNAMISCDNMSDDKKCQELRRQMEKLTCEDTVVAFSGGADSALLLKLACDSAKENGRKVYAVTVHSKLHPAKDLETAKKTAEELEAEHIVIETDELKDAGILDNPPDRCYRCKKYMFAKVLETAEKLGVSCVLEGTNADDTKEYRPGLRALEELGIISPLKIADLTKEEVRRLAAHYEIRVSDRPSSPCLATRFPYHTRLSYEELEKADIIEQFIRSMGYGNVRARIHGQMVRIEVDASDIGKLVTERAPLISMIRRLGYDYVSVDLEGFRSGSQDAVLSHGAAVEELLSLHS